MKYTKENILEGINAKIDSLDIPERIKRLFRTRIPQYPVEIEQNILEWINNEPLTDVDCHGESIIKAMQYKSLSDEYIPHLIVEFVGFKESQFRVSNGIWRVAMG